MSDVINRIHKISAVMGEALKLTKFECLTEICRAVRVEFGARTALIGSLRIVEAEHIFVEAASTDVENLDLTDYPARGTPCHKAVFDNEFVAVQDNVTQIYPEASVVARLGSRGYIGCPLTNLRGETTGVFALEWPDAISASRIEDFKAAIEPFLQRISEELSRMQTHRGYKAMISPVGPKASTSVEIFRTTVKQAAEMSGVHTVLLAKNCNDDPMGFKILASYSDGSLELSREGEAVPYAGTACSNMIDSDLYFHENGLVEKYPNPSLIRYGAQSYLGFGFRDGKGRTIGHIAFVHNRPMASRARKNKLIQMISSRAGLELQRFELELDRNAMETALRVRSKLESLGIMAGTIAHDFNNQLAVMIGNTELALMETPATEPMRSYLDAAEDSMWRARDVIGELMDFAGNAPSAANEPIALGEIISSTLNEFKPQQTGELTIRSKVEDGLPKIMGRRAQLIQVLSNLVRNSLDASERGKPFYVQVKAGWVNRTDVDEKACLTGHCADLPDRCILLEVCDTGAGMDGATAEHVFDPYFSTKGVSRGLGLSSVLGLTKRFGIGLTFESKPNKGTVFRLYFQHFEEGVSAVSDQVPTSGGIHRKSVLVVDDDDLVRNVVARFLQLQGYHVHRASSGEEALNLVQTIPGLDLAVIDVIMPGMNGFETMSALRGMLGNVPSILISGFSERNLSDSFDPDETTKFLAKPFSMADVRKTVAELMA